MQLDIIHSKLRSQCLREWILYLIFCLVLGGAVGYLSYSQYCHTKRFEQGRLSNQASIVHDMIVLQFEAINTTLTNIRNEFLLKAEKQPGTLLSFQGRLSTLSEAMTTIRTLSVMDAKGTVVASSHSELLGMNFSEREYFQAAAAAPNPNTLYLSPPFASSLKAWTLALSRAMVDSKGKFTGLVVASLNPILFKGILASTHYTSDVWASLAHGDGLVLIMSPEMGQVAGTNLDTPGSFYSQLKESGQDSLVALGTIALTGEFRMIALKSISPPSLRMNKPLIVGVTRDYAAIYAGWRDELYLHIALFSLVCLLAGIGLFVTHRGLTRAARKAEEADRKLQASLEELESIFAISPDLLCIVDRNGQLRKLNPAVEKILGLPADTLVGTGLLDLVHPEDVDATKAALSRLTEKRDPISFTNRYSHPDGSFRYIEWRASTIGGVCYLSARDITEHKEAEQRLEEMAYHDRLTGLPNRALFFNRFSQAISNAKRYQGRVGLLFIDLDGFKAINDTHGHDAGDTVLKTVAERLLNSVRGTDTVSRAGGDEFLVLLFEVASQDDAGQVARKLLDAVGEPVALPDRATGTVGASIGISIYPDDKDNMDALLVAADEAMYVSKSMGKNRYTYFSAQEKKVEAALIQVRLDDAHLVGVAQIDGQHKHMADLVNQLVKLANSKADNPKIGRVLNQLTEYTVFHFRTEHDLMEHHGYPKMAAHDAAHAHLVDELSRFRTELSQGADLFLLGELNHWLLDHIIHEDIPLGEFLRQSS